MHVDALLPYLGPLIALAATSLGGWLLSRLTGHATALARAQALSLIASEAAAAVVALNPSASWAALLKDTVDRIANAAGLPTANRLAIENAASAALTTLGKNPGAAPVIAGKP